MGSPLLFTRYVFGSSADFIRSVCCKKQESMSAIFSTGLYSGLSKSAAAVVASSSLKHISLLAV